MPRYCPPLPAEIWAHVLALRVESCPLREIATMRAVCKTWALHYSVKSNWLSRPLPALTGKERHHTTMWTLELKGGVSLPELHAIVRGSILATTRSVMAFTPNEGKSLSNTSPDVIELFRSSCESGALQTAKWFAARYGIERRNINSFTCLRAAVTNGHLPVVKWLVKRYEPDTPTVRGIAFNNPGGAVANDCCWWLVAHYGLQ
jgi:ankyrin repeat protein